MAVIFINMMCVRVCVRVCVCVCVCACVRVYVWVAQSWWQQLKAAHGPVGKTGSV